MSLLDEEVTVDDVDDYDEDNNNSKNYLVDGTVIIMFFEVFSFFVIFCNMILHSEVFHDVEVSYVTYFVNCVSSHENRHNFVFKLSVQVLSNDFDVSCHEQIFVLLFHQFFQESQTCFFIVDNPVSPYSVYLDCVSEMFLESVRFSFICALGFFKMFLEVALIDI